MFKLRHCNLRYITIPVVFLLLVLQVAHASTWFCLDGQPCKDHEKICCATHKQQPAQSETPHCPKCDVPKHKSNACINQQAKGCVLVISENSQLATAAIQPYEPTSSDTSISLLPEFSLVVRSADQFERFYFADASPPTKLYTTTASGLSPPVL